MKKILFLGLFLLNMANIFASKEFSITPAFQEKTLWCWAASCEMVLDAYGNSSDQYDIANWAVGNQNKMVDMYGDAKTVDRVLAVIGGIETLYNLAALTEWGITYEIGDEDDNGVPIIAGIDIGGVGHVVVIRGYTGSGGDDVGNVIFNDPNPYFGGRRVLPFDDFVDNGPSWRWNETLRMTTMPRIPIPVGLYDYARISDGGTTTVTPSTTSLSYTAVFHNADTWPTHPVSWDWKLIFVHAGGECIARSWTSTSTGSQLTWNISGFSLPTGYQWYYNYDGEIPGRIELDLLDSDGFRHFDAITVSYE